MAQDGTFGSADGPWTELGNGARRRILLDRPEMTVVAVDFVAGGIGPAHSHPHVQASFVERGAFDVTVGGVTRRLGAGESFIVAPDVVHGVAAVEAGRLIDSFTPRRDEFFQTG